jgi:hypothetical protein
MPGYSLPRSRHHIDQHVAKIDTPADQSTGRWQNAGAAAPMLPLSIFAQPAGAAGPDQCLHCGLDAPPLTTSVSQTPGTE